MKKLIYSLLLLMMFSCSQEREIIEIEEEQFSSPEISVIKINSQDSYAGDEIIIDALVSDLDDNISTYAWSVSEGSFEKVSSTRIKRKSPNQSGTYSISLTVTDSKDNSTSKSENVDLKFLLKHNI